MTLTKAHIVEAIEVQNEFPKKQSSEIVETLQQFIKRSFESGRLQRFSRNVRPGMGKSAGKSYRIVNSNSLVLSQVDLWIVCRRY